MPELEKPEIKKGRPHAPVTAIHQNGGDHQHMNDFYAHKTYHDPSKIG